MSSDDVRARRAERVREQKAKEMPKVVAKNVAIGLAALVVVGALGYAIWWTSFGKPDNVHWHSAWEVYYWDEKSGTYIHPDYTNPGYDLSSGSPLATPPRNHLHPNGSPGSDNIVHLEAKPPPFPMGKFFDALGVDMRHTSVKMDALHGGATLRNNDTHAWRLFVQPATGDWHVEEKFEKYNARNGDRLLFTYGSSEEMDVPGGELERQLASVDTDVPGFSNAQRGEDKLPGGGGESSGSGGNNNTTAVARRD